MTCDLCRENKIGLIWLHNAGEKLAVCRDCEEDLMANRLPDRPRDVGEDSDR